MSNKTVDPTHSAKLPTRPKPSAAKPEPTWHMDTCNVPVKKKIFFKTHVPPTYPTLFHHTFHTILSPLFGWLTHFLFFFFSFSLIHSSLSLSHPLSLVPPYHHFHHHFSGKITEKSLRTYKHLHIFFEVKVSNLFSGFYTFAWGYFYLRFNNDTHVIYEHWKWYLCVFICMGFVLVKLFDEWVYGLY